MQAFLSWTTIGCQIPSREEREDLLVIQIDHRCLIVTDLHGVDVVVAGVDRLLDAVDVCLWVGVRDEPSGEKIGSSYFP